MIDIDRKWFTQLNSPFRLVIVLCARTKATSRVLLPLVWWIGVHSVVGADHRLVVYVGLPSLPRGLELVHARCGLLRHTKVHMFTSRPETRINLWLLLCAWAAVRKRIDRCTPVLPLRSVRKQSFLWDAWWRLNSACLIARSVSVVDGVRRDV